MTQVASFLGRPWTGARRTEDSQRGTPLEAALTLRHPLDAATVDGVARAGGELLGEFYGRPLPGTLAPR